jgi:limonene-1,2-epoxide hydrolase
MMRKKTLSVALVLALLAAASAPAETKKKTPKAPAVAESKPPTGEESAKLVRAFIDSWFKGDPEQAMSYLAEDVYFWNVPIEPIKGRAKARKFLEPFLENDPLVVPFAFRTDLKRTLSDGANVVVERVDTFEINGKKWQIPVVGVFEVRNDKIAVWKDYFDMAQFQPVATLVDVLAKKK